MVKLVIATFALALASPALAAPTKHLPVRQACSLGFYTCIPADMQHDPPFSMEVQPTAIQMLNSDYSNIFAQRQNKAQGIIQFYDPQAGVGPANYWLMCSGSEAFLVADRSDAQPMPHIYRLTRTTGDLWAESKKRGWNIEE